MYWWCTGILREGAYGSYYAEACKEQVKQKGAGLRPLEFSHAMIDEAGQVSPAVHCMPCTLPCSQSVSQSSIRPSVRLSVHPSIHPTSVNTSVRQSIHPSNHAFAHSNPITHWPAHPLVALLTGWCQFICHTGILRTLKVVWSVSTISPACSGFWTSVTVSACHSCQEHDTSVC